MRILNALSMHACRELFFLLSIPMGDGPGRSLYRAIQGDDLPAITRLLEEHPSVVDVRAVLNLENMGPNGSTVGEWVVTPVIFAVLTGRTEATRILVDHGADVNGVPTGPEGMTPLFAALVSTQPDPVLDYLMEKGADPFKKGRRTGITGLILAASVDRVGAIRMMLSRPGAEEGVNVTDNVGLTALAYACQRGAKAAARVLLLEGKANHRLANAAGSTALDLAREYGHRSCAQLLEWFEGELSRAYLLSKARVVEDCRQSLQHTPPVGAGGGGGGGGGRGVVRTRAILHQARVDLAPLCLKTRVAVRQTMPHVEWKAEAVGRKRAREERGGARGSRKRRSSRQEVREVGSYVVGHMKDDVFAQLMRLMRLRTDC